MAALRALLPPYDGPGVTLYRGQWPNRRRLGLAWSLHFKVARAHAQAFWLVTAGPRGTAVYKADAPAEAIICAPHLLSDSRSEREFIVDCRRLRDVGLVERFAPRGMPRAT